MRLFFKKQQSRAGKIDRRVYAGGYELLIRKSFFRIAQIAEEWDADVTAPEDLIHELKSRHRQIDILTFVQRLPHAKPLFDYRMELDNVAAIPITTYEHWWTKQANQEVRNKVRKAKKKGVIVREVAFSDSLVNGIKDIYDETPVRQGRAFSHYRMSFEETKEASATYLDRAHFIGAYFGDELIGFAKIVTGQNFARTMGILVKNLHRDKAPMNALIDRAVELCALMKTPYLVYGKYQYGTKGEDSLAQFKRYNGFIKYELPRYFIPMNAKGKIILALKLHKRVNEILPRWIIKPFLGFRKLVYGKKSKANKEGV